MKPLVSAENVVLQYGDNVAVRQSSFTLPAGGVTAIIGPNGSGKSTMLHAIGGLLPVSAGSLTVAGEDPRAHKSGVAYVLQSMTVPVGVPITVREAVTMGRYAKRGWFGRISRADREAVDHALEALDLKDLAKRHLWELSGGQRQRVYVAQGICQEHDILLLDEPLTGLDLRSAKVIDQIIHHENHAGCSVIMTTHALDEARACDNVILMNGRVLAAGKPDEVLTQSNLEEAYGLGALHEHVGVLIDDPHSGHHH